MLPAISEFFESLAERGITYCHWKSNWALPATLSGETDIDLLVKRQDARRFRQLLDELGYRPAIETGVNPIPSVEHYHSMDEDGGDLVHVHAYYRVITGESLAKNYRFPFEEMLLETIRSEGIVTVPSKGAELIVFVVRMLLKHTQFVELAMVARDWRHVQDELDWLLTDGSFEEALGLLREWLPQIDESVFRSGVDALGDSSGWLRRVVLGYRMRARLRSFARHGAAFAQIVGMRKFLGMAFHRLTKSKKRLTPAGGGAVIAFVGSEATGKSTLLEGTENWLGEHYTVRRIHAGKPPSTALTFLPNRFLPVLRAWIPGQRTTRIEAAQAARAGAVGGTFPILYGLRSVMLAYDRRSLLTRAFANSANGTIVLCDRYPSSASGAPDSPQLAHLSPESLDPLRRLIANAEKRLYRDVPSPDLVIHLTAPLDVTLERNALRDKTEPEEFVKLRHGRSIDLRFDNTPVHRLDTDQPIENTLRQIRQIIWHAL